MIFERIKPIKLLLVVVCSAIFCYVPGVPHAEDKLPASYEVTIDAPEWQVKRSVCNISQNCHLTVFAECNAESSCEEDLRLNVLGRFHGGHIRLYFMAKGRALDTSVSGREFFELPLPRAGDQTEGAVSLFVPHPLDVRYGDKDLLAPSVFRMSREFVEDMKVIIKLESF